MPSEFIPREKKPEVAEREHNSDRQETSELDPLLDEAIENLNRQDRDLEPSR